MISIFIIDDEQHAIDVLAAYIARTPGLSLSGSFTDPLQALEPMAERPPALAFLDIDMPGLNGIQFAGLTGKQTSIVFTTSFREFGPEAFEHGAIDYLLKPIAYDRFLKCIQKIKGAGSHIPDPFLVLKGNAKGKFHKIIPEDILYIESELHYIHIYLKNQDSLTVHLTIPEIASRLGTGEFIRIHRSFIINLKWLQAVEQNQVRISGIPALLPVGRDFREPFLERLNGSLLVPGKDVK